MSKYKEANAEHANQYKVWIKTCFSPHLLPHILFLFGWCEGGTHESGSGTHETREEGVGGFISFQLSLQIAAQDRGETFNTFESVGEGYEEKNIPRLKTQHIVRLWTKHIIKLWIQHIL